MSKSNTKHKYFTYLKKLMPYIWHDKHLFLAGLFSMLLVSGARLLDPLIIAHIIDVSIPKNDIKDMFIYAGLFVIVIIFSGIIAYFQTITLSKLGIKIVTKIKAEVFDHLLQLPVSYFDQYKVGELMARVESDAEKVKQLFSSFSIMIIGNIMFFLGMVIILLWKSTYVTILLMIPIIIITFLMTIMIRYLNKYYKKIRKLYARVSGVLTEYIQGMHIVQLFNKERDVKDIIDKVSKEKQSLESRTLFTEYSFWGLFSFIANSLFLILVIWLLAPKVISGIATLGTLIIFIQYGSRILDPLMGIAENLTFIQKAFVSLERIFNILAVKTEYDIREGNIVPQFNNEIIFKDVWFKYKEDEWVLKGINLSINKGEKVAFVGASGSGKTTTISLLCGFYKITKGQIEVDGCNLNHFKLKQWRSKIGLVLQDVYLFPGNILENIRIYNDNISTEKINSAISTVQADSFINKTEKGIYSEISERGQNISSGEKQLLSFARAIAFSPEIIVLDEATASVDVVTEKKIEAAMKMTMKGKTAVIVAHRLSSIINADKILLFQNGNIIAQGTHNELLASSLEYKRLVELQFMHITGKTIKE